MRETIRSYGETKRGATDSQELTGKRGELERKALRDTVMPLIGGRHLRGSHMMSTTRGTASGTVPLLKKLRSAWRRPA
jgi:hypothetical protein